MNNFIKDCDSLNAPELAYFVLHNKIKRIGGREANHIARLINGIEIDLRIPEKEMKILMALKKVEMRSSCEGSENYGPFFIFRFVDNKDKKFINSFCDYMMYKDSSTLSKFGMGRMNEYRIIVTGNFLKDSVTKTEYNNWWKNVTKKMEHFCKNN